MKHIRKISAALIAIALLFAVLVFLGNDGVREVTWTAREVSDHPGTVPESALRAAQAMTDGEGCEVLDAYEGRGQVVRLDTDGRLSLAVNAPADGDYRLLVGYHTLEGKGIDMEFTLDVDGQPYGDGKTVTSLNRIWVDDGAPRRTTTGNDLRPKQLERFVWTEALLADSNAASGEAVLTLTAGEHTVTLTNLRDALVIDYVLLKGEEALPTYQEYSAAHGDVKTEPVQLLLQAENALSKSASAIYPTYDRTSSHTQPYHPTQMRLNTIGGSGWKQVGEWVEWELDVPADGLYQIGLRYHQNQVKGYYVTRRVMLDGQVPFAELEAVKFTYHADWDFMTFGEDAQHPYLFYMTKGKHTLRMQVTLGDMAPLLEEMQDTVYALNEMYRQIIMITGTEPDFYRDYYLEKVIPNLTERLTGLADTLDGYQTRMDELLGSHSTAGQTIQVLSYQMREFAKEPYTIQKRLTTFSSNISAFAEWTLSVREQPLEIDYFVVSDPAGSYKAQNDNLFDSVKREVSAFLGSFTQDYNAFGGGEQNVRQEPITVWLSTGRDQATVINRLIEERFTAETGIPVNLQLVSGALLKATIAGQGPDVNLFTGRGEVMNLAFRGALADLSGLTGYADTVAELREGAQIPYSFEEGVYGLAEGQDFLVMFVRDDVLEDLQLEVPETWTELMNIAPILQSNNLGIGLPYAQLDGNTVLSNGVGLTNIFPSLLLQRGGSIYTEDHRATLLHEPVANAAFRMWTDFYTQYDYELYKDDFTRFRTGEMPVIITSYGMYTRLEGTAPEIAGKWSMHLLPGTEREDGTVDHTSAANGSAAVMLSTCKNPEACWEFLRWWVSAETQATYARDIESDLGVLGRHTTANREAFSVSNWSIHDQRTLDAQWAWVYELPEIPGGYYVSRNLDNAFRAVVLSNEDPRESLFYWTSSTNEEILRKRDEMGLE
ncbi:MAG: extracellular solute-binding protein [Clostridiales bacterium]|nr:extracellular solute-binding protein [Clostridiales bacterium]